MPVTIKEIAKMANVSIATVSRVINNKSEGVSESKRQEILDLVASFHYHPNHAARSLVSSHSQTLGFIIPDITNPFYPNVARGVEDTAIEYGFNLFLCNSDGNPKKEIKYLNTLCEKRVEGLIFNTRNSHENATLQQELRKIDIPLVFVDEPPLNPDENTYGVFPDDYYGGYTAVEHLLHCGHTQIACLAGPENATSVNWRVKGYSAALKKANIAEDYQTVLYGAYDVASGYQNMSRLIDEAFPVTAVFATNDLIAYGAYQAIRDHGLSVPNNYSIIGFDDLIISRFLTPALSTISVDAYKLGTIAADMLCRRIMNKPIENKTVWLRPKLVARDSVRTISSRVTPILSIGL